MCRSLIWSILQRNATFTPHSHGGYSVWCGCSVPVAEWLYSFTVGIAQLAHAADECILCRVGWWCGSSQITIVLVYIETSETADFIPVSLFECCSSDGRIYNTLWVLNQCFTLVKPLLFQ